jgi:hypothetical protein
LVPLTELYHLADEQSYNLYWIRSSDERICSMSVTDGIHCAIMLDPSRLLCEAQQRQMLAHELGHCSTGAFYNRHAKRDLRQKHENRADQWAIKKLISKVELDFAVSTGHTELWDLADYFGVTERSSSCPIRYSTVVSRYSAISGSVRLEGLVFLVFHWE